MSQYYVYVYIDPRNFEKFHFGKSKGSRKEEHLFEESESSKVKRIKQIKDGSLTPIIRVIAKDLSEEEALLIEKTLLRKLGSTTIDVSTGHFPNNFRPRNTLHLELS